MSFTEDQIEDLKQLLAANNRALISELEPRFDKIDQRFEGIEQKFEGLEQKFDTLSGKFDDLSGKFDGLSEFVRDTIDTTNDATGEEIAELKSRVTALEQATA